MRLGPFRMHKCVYCKGPILFAHGSLARFRHAHGSCFDESAAKRQRASEETPSAARAQRG